VATQLVFSSEDDITSVNNVAGHFVRLLRSHEWNTPDFITAWNHLATNASEPNPFCESWYLRPALEQFDIAGAVQMFVLQEGTRIVGLIPLSHERRYGRWRLPNVQNWLHPNAFLGCPLVRSGYEEAFWQALLDHVDGGSMGGLFLHINGFVSGGALHTALEQVCYKQSRQLACVYHSERAFLKSALTPAAYYEAAVRSKKRKEIRRQQNRLGEHGALVFTRSDGRDGAAKWANEFLKLERRGWKGAQGSSLDSANQTRALFCAALEGAAALGRLELLDLRLDGKPVAMLVNFLCAPGAFSYKTAFDEDYARFSPGVLLQIENLALLNHEDITWCDSCAAEGHPMIDSLWTGRRGIGRCSIAIGGVGRRALFGMVLRAEMARMKRRG
jgi:hypothetical protein